METFHTHNLDGEEQFPIPSQVVIVLSLEILFYQRIADFRTR